MKWLSLLLVALMLSACGSSPANAAADYTFMPKSVPDDAQKALRQNFEVAAKFVRSAVAGDQATMQALWFRPKTDSTNYNKIPPKLDSADFVRRYSAHGPIEKVEFSLYNVANDNDVWVAGYLYYVDTSAVRIEFQEYRQDGKWYVAHLTSQFLPPQKKK
jgi:hypothetical protein